MVRRVSRYQKNPPRKTKACAQKKVTVAVGKGQVQQRRLGSRPGFIVGLGTRNRAEAGQ